MKLMVLLYIIGLIIAGLVLGTGVTSTKLSFLLLYCTVAIVLVLDSIMETVYSLPTEEVTREELEFFQEYQILLQRNEEKMSILLEENEERVDNLLDKFDIPPGGADKIVKKIKTRRKV